MSMRDFLSISFRLPFSIALLVCVSFTLQQALADELHWERFATLPNELGVAGPFAGLHHGVLLIAGGANFPRPVWENDKAWVDDIHVLADLDGLPHWKSAGKLPRPMAYGMTVSTPDGIICMGGNDAAETFRDVCLLRWHAETESLERIDFPPLPQPCAYGQAVLIDHRIYLAGGQSGLGLDTALNNFWMLDLNFQADASKFVWEVLPAWPGPSRAYNITVAQHSDSGQSIFVISGRREQHGTPQFLSDTWEYSLSTGEWRERAALPEPRMAGMAIPVGDTRIAVIGGANGSLFDKADELRDAHPGFSKIGLMYNVPLNRWESQFTLPANHVTTQPVPWGDACLIPSGELRPRVRSPQVWKVSVKRNE